MLICIRVPLAVIKKPALGGHVTPHGDCYKGVLRLKVAKPATVR
jgi:hypothetical protein